MRRVDPRFVTALESSSFTSLGYISAHYGPFKFVVLNLSEGGAALRATTEIPKEFKVGAQFDVSMEIHKKPFPTTIVVRGMVGGRVHCQFLIKTPAFEQALKEFFVPKTIGVALSRNESLSDHPEVQALVPESEWHEVWVAPNQTGVFVWFGEDDHLLRVLLVSKDLAWEWEQGKGAKSGHRVLGTKNDTPQQAFEINWEREMSPSTKSYVYEILCSWLGMSDDSRAWVAKLVQSTPEAASISGCQPLLRRLRGG